MKLTASEKYLMEIMKSLKKYESEVRGQRIKEALRRKKENANNRD